MIFRSWLIKMRPDDMNNIFNMDKKKLMKQALPITEEIKKKRKADEELNKTNDTKEDISFENKGNINARNVYNDCTKILMHLAA